jgi:hypothetical protein
MSESEFLTADEVYDLTGYKLIASQRDWLNRNGWVYVTNAAGRPIVGRLFARFRLGGMQAPALVSQDGRPNFAALD